MSLFNIFKRKEKTSTNIKNMHLYSENELD